MIRVLFTCEWFVSHSYNMDTTGLLTFVAKFKLLNVSLRCSWSGLIMTNMSVFELPPKEFCKR